MLKVTNDRLFNIPTISGADVREGDTHLAGYGRDGTEFTRHRELSPMRFGRRAAERRVSDRPVRRKDANCNA